MKRCQWRKSMMKRKSNWNEQSSTAMGRSEPLYLPIAVLLPGLSNANAANACASSPTDECE